MTTKPSDVQSVASEKPTATDPNVVARANELSPVDGDREVEDLEKFGFGCGMLHPDGPPRWSDKK